MLSFLRLKFRDFREEHGDMLRNFSHLMSLQAVTYILPLITVPYLIRVLGAEKFGMIAFARAFVQYFIIFTDYGFNLSATKDISINRDNKERVSRILSSVLLIKIAIAILGLLLFFIAISAVPRFRMDWRLYLLAYGGVITSVFSFSYFFQGMEKMKYITYINLASMSAYLISLFVFVRTEADYLNPFLIVIVIWVFLGVVGLWIIKNKFGISLVFPDLGNIKNELEQGWHVFISTMAITGYTNTRIFAVGLFTNNIVTGYYAIAEQLMVTIQCFPLTSFMQAAYPRLSKIYSQDKTRAFRMMSGFQKKTDIVFLFYLPIIFFLAPFVVKVFAGKAYPETIIALRVLLVGVYFIVANAFRVQFLLVSHRESVFSRIHIIAGILGSVLVMSMAYFFTYTGAALSITVIAFIVLVWTRYQVKAE